jgi:hypothetical protein
MGFAAGAKKTWPGALTKMYDYPTMCLMRTKSHMSQKEVWDSFFTDKNLLDKNKVTDEELKFLQTVELFGSFKSVDDILLVLRNIR